MANLSIDSICARLKKVPVGEWKEEYAQKRHTYYVDISGMNFRVSYEKTETPRAADDDNPSGIPLVKEEAQLVVIDTEKESVVFTTQEGYPYHRCGMTLVVDFYKYIKESVDQYQQKNKEQKKKTLLAAGRAKLEAILNE